ncbi:MAG: serine protease [Hyphomicrobium sp.]|nr:MAG: serine protease [Hyphomicrobium sp.]
MTPTLPDIPQVEIAIVELTNAFRRENRLGEVKINANLSRAARDYAAYLARTNTFSHTADGREPAERAQRAGYSYCQIAENLASNLDSRGFQSSALASQAVEGWKNSPGHRRNMLAEHVVEIGVAVVKAPDKDPKFLSVQLFGRPKELAYEFKISNVSDVTVTYAFAGTAHEIAPRHAVTHSACLPGEIVIELQQGLARSGTVASRYNARNGQVYTLKSGPKGTLVLDISGPAGAQPAATPK